MNQQSKSTEEQLRDFLIEEAKEAHRLITLSDQKFRKQQDINRCYLISRNWFNQWCEYVGYLEVIADLEPESEKFAQVKPIKLINEEFIQQQDDKSIIGNQQLFKFDEKRVAESSYLNIILKQDQNINTFKAVDEDTWKFFSRRYPVGLEIQRPVFHYQNRIIQNVQLLQPEIVVFNEELVEQVYKLSDLQLKNGVNSLNSKKCQFPSFYTLSQLKDIIKRQFNVNSVRVWRFDASQKREDIQFQTGKSIKQKQFQVRAIELEESKLGKSIVLQDIIKNHYCLIFELPIRGKFELKQQNQSQTSSGKFVGICEYCTKLLELKVRCVCKEVAYCSQNCKYKDQDYHSHICEVAADSESDEEMDFLPLEISGKAGLKNIGNTCYLAAALQNIYITKEFSQKFTMNEIQKIPNQRCKLLQKFSKLLKEMSMQNEESIEPWSFKTQLGLINQMFSGNYQHDSAELLTCLFDALNDECQKEDKQNGNKNADFSKPDQFWENCVKSGYNKAIVDSFLGLYESSIQCPDCNNTSVSYDPFSILSLPIKQKPVVKQIMVNFIRGDIMSDIIHTRTTYTTGSTTIIDLIKFVCDENQVVYNNNIVVCTYNGESIQQAYIKPEQLKKTVEELETELEGKNKSLIFYEVNFDTTTFDALKHKIIKINFARIGKIQIGIMQVDEKTNFSAPRIIIVDKSQNTSSIYVQLFEQLQDIYPEASQLVKDSFEEYKEIQSETELNNEQQSQKTVSTSELEDQRKLEDAKWNGTSDSPIKAKNDGKQEQKDSQKNSKQPSQQNISPPKQQQQTVQPAQVESSGWGDYEIPVIPPKRQTQQQQKGQKEQQNKQKETPQQTQQTKQSQVTTTQQQPKQSEIKNNQQTSNAIQSQNSTLASSSVAQSTQSVSSNDGGWGWDSEIIVAPKKVTPVQKSQPAPPVQNQVQQAANKQEEEEFTQVSNKKGKNSKQNNESNQDNYNNNNNKKYDNYNNNKNQQSNNKFNASKNSDTQKQVATTTTTNTKSTTNVAASKNITKPSQNSVNTFSGWGDEEPTSNVLPPTSQQTVVNSTQQNSDKQQPSNDTKLNNPAQSEQITQQSDSKAATNKVAKKIVVQKEDFSELLAKLPFSINIRSKKRRLGGAFKCFFCGKQNCQNCVFSYENQKTLSQLLQNYRDLFELELFWQKEQPSKVLYKMLIDQNSANSQAKKQNLPTLKYCFEEFSQKEQLSEENMWFCIKCKKSQQAFKKLSIKYAPNNLIIQIKRFKTNLQDGSKEKNYQQVIFPESGFSLSNDENTQASPSISSVIKNKELLYELYGVIIHEGTTENGHYIAHCKYDKLWYSFDDDNITIIDTEKVLNNKNAYILFYRLQK